MKVLVVMGSKSNSQVAENVTAVLDDFGIPYDLGLLQPVELLEKSKSLQKALPRG